MALIKCEKCGALISNHAKRCPNCERIQEKRFAYAGMMILIIIFVLIAIKVFCF